MNLLKFLPKNLCYFYNLIDEVTNSRKTFALAHQHKLMLCMTLTGPTYCFHVIQKETTTPTIHTTLGELVRESTVME